MVVRGVLKFLSMRALEGFVAILLITFMPNLPPDAKYSQSYDLTPVLPFEGPLTLNKKLEGTEIWHKGDFHGPEAFAVYNGELYTTIHGGNVVKMIGEDIAPVVKFGKMCKGFHQEHICGRPLGMQFDKNGNLYVADAYYGIFKVDVKTGKQVQLVSMDEEINGKKARLPNSVAVASNGDVYWTDSSTEFFLYDGIFDMLADGSGRLIHYDAKNKRNTVLIDKVHFSNGVKLATDESFVLVTETARCRVHRYYLKGPKKGTHDIFLDGLPGLPDNIQTDGKDGFLFPLVVGRDDDFPPPLNIFGPFPLTRKFFSRMMALVELGFKAIDQIFPNEWAERSIHYIGHFASLPHSFSSPRQSILHVSKDGEILDSIHSLDGSILGMSEAFIFKDMLYMGSPFNDYVGRIPLAKVGWEHLALKESDYPSSKSAETTKASATPTAEPKITDAPKMATPQPTQAPRVVTQPPTTEMPKPAPKEAHIHKREAPAQQAPEPQVTTPAPSVRPTAPQKKPAAATPSAPKPVVNAQKPPAPAPKPASPAPPQKQAPPATKPSAPAPSAAKPAAPAPSPKPAAAPSPSAAPKPSAPAPAAAKPASPPPPAAKPSPPPPAKPAAPAPQAKPAAAPSPPPAKQAAPAPPPKPAAAPAPPVAKQAAPAPPPKPAAAPSPPPAKQAVPAPPPPKPAAAPSPPVAKQAAPAAKPSPPPATKPAATAPPPKPAAAPSAPPAAKPPSPPVVKPAVEKLAAPGQPPKPAATPTAKPAAATPSQAAKPATPSPKPSTPEKPPVVPTASAKQENKKPDKQQREL